VSERRLHGWLDWILIGALLIISGSMLAVKLRHHESAMVVIRCGDVLIGRFPLDQDRLVVVQPGIEVEIRDGRARMHKSTCRNQLCVRQGWSRGTPIICLPQKVSIEFESKKNIMQITY
jgi:hypothetical protein